jgi:hypothetical protein
VVVGGVWLAASVAALGPSLHREFPAHLRVYDRDFMTNRMGLRTVLSQVGRDWRPTDGRPATTQWQAARAATLARSGPVRLLLGGGVVLAFALTVARVRTLWLALALSAAILPVTTDLLCYYYVYFLLAAALTRARRELEPVLLLVAGVSPLVGSAFDSSMPLEVSFARESVLFVSLGVALLVAIWQSRSGRMLAPEQDQGERKVA